MTRKCIRYCAAAAALFLMIALAGCGQGRQATRTPAATPTPVDTQQPTPTPTPVPTPTPTPRPVITIRSIFPGTEPKGLPAVFEELNGRLQQELFTRLEIGWSPSGQYDADIAEAVASGSIDFIWCSSAKLPGYAEKNLLAPIDGPMAEFGQAIYDNIDKRLFDTMKIGGQLMGIPSAGNMPLADTDHAFTVREDLRLKLGFARLNSIKALESFFKAVKENEPGITPVCSENTASVIMKAFGPEDYLAGTNNAVAYKINEDSTVTCMAIQDAASFKGAAAKARAWFKAGWIPKDILGVDDTKARMTTGLAAVTGGKAMSASSMQAAAAAKVHEAVLEDQPVFGAAKFLTGNGGNALCLSSSAKNPAEVVQFWAWVYKSQDNYDLICYGLEDIHYEIADNRIVILDKGYSAFPSSMFRNINLMRFGAGISDEYIETLRHWNDGAELSPLIGFVFSTAKVKNELTKVKAVVAAYGPALNTGSADTALLLAGYAAKLKAAGQDKIVAEAQAQVNAFLASK